MANSCASMCTVTIDASKDGVKFACQGDIGNGAVTLRSHQNVEKPELNIEIELSEPVSLTFSLKYLVNFCKASALSSQVKICLSNEVPLLVEYSVQGNSWLRFYLAPKVRVLLLLFCGVDWPHVLFERETNICFHRLAMRSRLSGAGASRCTLGFIYPKKATMFLACRRPFALNSSQLRTIRKDRRGRAGIWFGDCRISALRHGDTVEDGSKLFNTRPQHPALMK